MNSFERSWRDAVGEYDATAQEKMVAYLGHVTTSEVIPQPYREMILFSSSTAARFRPSMVTHGVRALEEGATPEQLFQAASLTALSCGFTSLILAVDVLDEIAPVGE